jgi:hypothetical protein
MVSTVQGLPQAEEPTAGHPQVNCMGMTTYL